MPDLMKMTPEDMERQLEANAIAQQNDAFRKLGFSHEAFGRWVTTANINSQGSEFVSKAVEAVRNFDAFTEENDPYGDHSFGAFEVDGQSVWWKIDLYDKSYLMGSVMPADTDKTRRVLTIMFPSDY